MMKIVVILSFLAVVSAELVVTRPGESTHSVTWQRFSAGPHMSVRASRSAGRPGTPADSWSAAGTNYPDEDMFVVLRRPKRNAKPKPLLIPLKMLESIKNNEKRHIDDSAEVTNEPALRTQDLSRLETSLLNRSLNSKQNKKKENFEENFHTPESPASSAEISAAGVSEGQKNVNREKIPPNIGNTNSSGCQSTNHEPETEMNDQTHPEMQLDSNIEAKALVGGFEQVVASSVSVGQPDNVEPRNLPHEQIFNDVSIISAPSEAGLSFDPSNAALNGSVASPVNYTSVDNVKALPSAHSLEGEQSVLRKLLQESILTQLAENKSHKPETDLSGESFGEIPSNSSSVVLHQLADIKQMLRSHVTEKNEIFMSNLDYKYKNYVEKTTSALELLKMRSEANVDNTKEKIELILENLSILKMMIFGQEQRILINDNRIEQFQELLNERMSCEQAANASATGALDTPKQQEGINITSLDDSLSGISLIDFNFTKLMERAPQMMNNTFEDIYEQIGKLEKSVASYDSKLDRYFLKRVESPRKEDTGLSETSSLCQCNQSELQIEIDSLKERITTLSSSMNEFKDAEKQNAIRSQIREESGNLEFLNGSESETATAELRVNNLTREKSEDDTLASKVKLLETKLAHFETELSSIGDLRNEVALLKQRLDRVHLTNTSSAGLCVWPYKPHGSQCYHVNTDERQNWGAARARCRELQGDLAAPPDYDAFRKFIQTQRLSRSYSFWIGASDSKEAGRWVWVTGEPVPGDVWATGHPNLMRSDRCMEVRPDLRLAAAGEACRVSNYFVCQQRGA